MKRLVLHIGGYERTDPARAHRRFARELRRFEATWSVTALVSDPAITDDEAAWQVAASGPNWRAHTEYRLFRWDDVIEALARRPWWARLAHGLRAFLDWIAAGVLWRYLRANWRYAAFFLYPFALLAAFAALAWLSGSFAAAATGSAPLGGVVGLLTLGLLMWWPGRRLYLFHLLDDWRFSREYIRQGHPILDQRLDRVAGELVAAARKGGLDEIVIVGHSLGAVLAVDLLDRCLRLDPGLGESGTPVAFLSVGSSILKIGLHGGAARFRRAVERVASAPGLFWAEYQALTDVMNFYKTDPVSALGVEAARHPLVRVVRISRMVSAARYQRIRRNFFRVHRQFVSANDRRATYDYFMLVCGPLPTEAQARSPDGAVSALGPDGSLLSGAEAPRDHPAGEAAR